MRRGEHKERKDSQKIAIESFRYGGKKFIFMLAGNNKRALVKNFENVQNGL